MKNQNYHLLILAVALMQLAVPLFAQANLQSLNQRLANPQAVMLEVVKDLALKGAVRFDWHEANQLIKDAEARDRGASFDEIKTEIVKYLQTELMATMVKELATKPFLNEGYVAHDQFQIKMEKDLDSVVQHYREGRHLEVGEVLIVVASPMITSTKTDPEAFYLPTTLHRGYKSFAFKQELTLHLSNRSRLQRWVRVEAKIDQVETIYAKTLESLFGHRHIIFVNPLLKKLPLKRVRSTIAHELGHYEFYQRYPQWGVAEVLAADEKRVESLREKIMAKELLTLRGQKRTYAEACLNWQLTFEHRVEEYALKAQIIYGIQSGETANAAQLLALYGLVESVPKSVSQFFESRFPPA